MQSNIIQKTLKSASCELLTVRSTVTGHVYQVRNHVKIYPWRRLRTVPECYLDTDRTPYTDKHNINEFKSIPVKKSWMKVIPKNKDARFNAYTWNDAYTSNPKVAKETAESRLERFRQSLYDRGAAREQKSYNPPSDVEERIMSVYKSMIGRDTEGSTTAIAQADSIDKILNLDLNQSKAFKFDFITKCISALEHDIPSSYLNEIATIRDVVDYFSTQVRGVNPFESLVAKKELPPNLSFLSEPTRYDKENDTFFRGNALPGILSKVHGLRASKKYPILNQDEFQWPDI